MKAYRIILWIVSAAFILAACQTAATVTPTPNLAVTLPTPDVPPIADVDAAIQRWDDSQMSRYYAEVQENSSKGQISIHLVVVDDQVRAAQKLTKAEKAKEWSEPVALTAEEARAYTIAELLARIGRDVVGDGPAPFNLRAAFDKGLGYPVAVHAEALPTINADGTVTLDRRYSYDLSVEIKTLLEDSFGAERQSILTLTHSGGPQALCDILRVFPDGSSVYADDCRGQLWQLDLSKSRLEEIKTLAAGFASLDEIQEADGASQRLMIRGSGAGSPDPQMVASAWMTAQIAYQLLSRAVGLGLNLLYVQDGKLYGYDIFNTQAQPTTLASQGGLHGVTPSHDNQYLAFSDQRGLHVMDLTSGENLNLLPPPAGGYYLPRSWANSGQLLVAIVVEGEVSPRLGWVSLAERTWHDLPLLEGSNYGCDTGAAWSPVGPQLAITGLGYGEPCNQNPGLTLVDLGSGSARRSVAPAINADPPGSAQITAGARQPDWSFDGQWIAFSLDQDAAALQSFPARLYRVRPDGSELTPLSTNSTGTADYPSWAPDGTLYYVLNGVSVEADGIYHYTPADNKHTLLIPGTGLRLMGVSPDGEFLAYAQDGTIKIYGFVSLETLLVVEPPADQPATFSGWLQIGR